MNRDVETVTIDRIQKRGTEVLFRLSNGRSIGFGSAALMDAYATDRCRPVAFRSLLEDIRAADPNVESPATWTGRTFRARFEEVP